MGRIEAALSDLRSLDELAQRDTALTRLDARARVVVTIVFCVVVVSFDRYALSALLPLTLFPLALAALGDLPGWPLLRRLAIAAPFAVLVGLFNPILDRAPMLVFGDVVISAGWVSFASILLRFALTVGAALVLVAGLGIHDLCAALSRLGLPHVFTAQLLFLFRYVFVLGGESSRSLTAYALRSGGRRPGLEDYGGLAGHGLLRAFERAQRVHGAMLARGFDGDLRSVRPLRWTHRDTAFVVGWCVFFIVVRFVNVPHWLGQAASALVS